MNYVDRANNEYYKVNLLKVVSNKRNILSYQKVMILHDLSFQTVPNSKLQQLILYHA
jgi:hypothetical protein